MVLFVGDEYLPSRVSERLHEVLDQIEEEIIEESQAETEENDPEAGPISYEDERRHIEWLRTRVIELIDGKTGWLNTSVDPAPSWFLDYQREIFEITLTRRWTDSLSNMLPWLIQP